MRLTGIVVFHEYACATAQRSIELTTCLGASPSQQTIDTLFG